MSEASSQQGQFEPIHAAHAIEQVLFSIQFDLPLDEAVFLQARDIAKQFKKELPGVLETHGLTFTVDASSPSIPTKGFVFRSVMPDGTVGNELRLEPNSITFRTALYSRWDAVWSQASTYFKALGSIYAAQTKISGITLHYVDKFVWAGDLTKFRPTLLLRDESKYLCPHVYTLKDLWHSHTGAFIRADTRTKRLLNVNVDCLDENRLGDISRVVAIATVLTDQLNQPGYEPCYVNENGIVELVDTHMQGLHIFGKNVLGDVINAEMCKRIALLG